ncbi:MAG: glycine--tRNA ligase subunit beta [Burkholderiaceae bacterium]|nr:glycine--tRNA ligase subunit beta [Burkholderiaceae bacterium]
MSAAALLIELFTEELPPKALERLSVAFADSIVAGLRQRDLSPNDAGVERFATPRRLAVRIDAVLSTAPDRPVEVKGPSVKVGLDADGRPTLALTKWCERQGADPARLVRASDGKQECFYFRAIQAGAALDASLQEILEHAIARLPIPKVMQYQLADGATTVSFVRPAHRLIALHGDRIVPVNLLGLDSGRETFGHRFQSSGPVVIESATAYEERLAQARVLAGFTDRRARIQSQLLEAAKSLNATLGEDDDAVGALLDEVTALVEWPAVYVGGFDEAFLAVPPECLILTMRTNQKYFPLFGAGGKLLPRFLIVSNMAIDEPEAIIDGNERVVRPRLADAQFFYEQDRRTALADRVPRLGSVVYHARLGTQAERMARVKRIAASVARRLGADVDHAERAATLAKTDLLTGMVGEFPELQGIMGTYYARHDGEAEAVALAMLEQYQPRFAGDALPGTETGTVLALADKLETLAGMFSIGQQPTGDKDPFALRRHALGVIRMLIEKQLDLGLNDMTGIAFEAFGDGDHGQASAALTEFMLDRLVGYLRERGFGAAQIAAVVDQRPDDLALVPARLAAVREFSALPQAEALAAANKRISNILRKADGTLARRLDHSLLAEDAEQALARCIDDIAPKVDAAIDRQDFTEAMRLVADAREHVDRFFEEVMVMAEDAHLRENRLALLATLRDLMNRVADISRLA